MHKVIKRMNPKARSAKYFAALKEQERKDAAREREKQRAAKQSKDLATVFLRQQKRAFDCYAFANPIEDGAYRRRLAKLLPGKRMPAEWWGVWFDAAGE